MDLDLIRQHVDALKDVLDIQINDNQQFITFSRVGREKIRKVVIAIAILVAVVAYVVMHQTVESVIIGFVILVAAGWYLSDGFRSVIVDIKRKRISSSLFNIISSDYQYEDYRGPLVYMMTLNGREPSPKEFCLKVSNKGSIKEIHLADLTHGKNSTPKENLKHISELWIS